MKLTKLAKYAFLSVLSISMGAAMVSCNDDDEIVDQPMWGDVLRGDNMTLQFYPDHFAYYWEYTFDRKANPSTGLVIEGEFPAARFLSYNVYDDDAQTSYCEKGFSLQDNQIKPDAGYSNPFIEADAGSNQKYTIYILPTDAPATITEGKNNIIWFDTDVKKVCTILRYYIPEGNIQGGVGMPVIKGLDLNTGKLVATPERVHSNLHGNMELPGAAFSSSPNLLFFRAPFSYAYPNGPAEYCYTRNLLEENEVMIFNFKAPSYPKDVTEYETADMRYWSVCVGNKDTYTPLAISDYQTVIDDNGFANYIIADKNSADYPRVKQLAAENKYNILEWDGKKWDKGIMVLYRNMVFDDDYTHSLRKLDPVDRDTDVMSNPTKYICVLALQQWGATGVKITTDKFIAADGKIQLRQQPK